MRGISLSLVLAAVLGTSVSAASPASAPGTWTTGTFSDGLSLLLTDGSILQQTAFSSSTWQRFYPDSTGHYDWAHPVPAATMNDTRGFFPSVVMRDGRVMVAGGEYGSGDHTAEIFDPVANTWTSVPNTLNAAFYDCSAVHLPDGRILFLANGPTHGFIYDPVAGAWSQTSENTFPFNETCAALVPGGAVFVVSPTTYPATAKYLPATDQWIAAAPAPSGADAFDSGGEGTKVLLYDGRIMAAGTTGNTGFYTPGSPTDAGSWTVGPMLPDGSKRQDAFAVVLPNGHVFLSADQGGHTGPTRFYDFDPASNTFVDVSPVAGGLSGYSDPYMALLLPTGEVLVSGVGIYTPSTGGPQDSWKPVITSVASLGGSAVRVTGQQLNGLTEGAYYGDDAQMSSNYPLVRLTDAGGSVIYARTFNFSTMAVATGSASETADFTLPSLADGTYQLEVVTNAIASAATPVQIQAGTVSGGGTPPSGGTGSAGGGGGSGGGGCGATGLEGVLIAFLLGQVRRARRRLRGESGRTDFGVRSGP